MLAPQLRGDDRHIPPLVPRLRYGNRVGAMPASGPARIVVYQLTARPTRPVRAAAGNR